MTGALRASRAARQIAGTLKLVKCRLILYAVYNTPYIILVVNRR